MRFKSVVTEQKLITYNVNKFILTIKVIVHYFYSEIIAAQTH